MPSAAQKRPKAKGKSFDTVSITTFFDKSEASLLKRRVCIAHTLVSTEGKTDIITVLPAKSDSDTGLLLLSVAVKLGATSPIATILPSKVSGVLPILTMPEVSLTSCPTMFCRNATVNITTNNFLIKYSFLPAKL